MSYFRQRNGTRNEYSGYQTASDGLRSRLAAVCGSYVAEGYIGGGQEGYWIPAANLNHEIKLHLNKNNINAALSASYDEAFEGVEIFLSVAEKCCPRRLLKIVEDIISAFDIAGSVYCLDPGTMQIELRVDEKLAGDIGVASGVLLGTRHAKDGYLNAVGGLMSRNQKPEDIVGDVFIAFEDYLKTITGTKDYGAAVVVLEKNGTISATQKSLLEKIYAYRSDTYGVGHAGNGEKPHEVDALWFLETVTAQILFLDRKLKK